MARQSAADRTRGRYRPDDVRVLFIGESPPTGGTFFYYANSNLYNATRAAFAAAIPALRREPEFLDAFQRLGCYAEDLSPAPVNDLELRDPRRRELRREGIEPIARRMKRWSPREVVIVMKDIEDDVHQALATTPHAGLPRTALPFPGRHYDRYVEELTELVRGWRRRRVLRPL